MMSRYRQIFDRKQNSCYFYFATAPTTRHELRAFPAYTEKISVWELGNHGASWLLLLCAIEILLLTYLLTYLCALEESPNHWENVCRQ